LCGSIVSGLRLHPGNWAGAYACWGTENREAALRFVACGPGNPQGGNVEVKVVDPSANPYFATATILGLALDGIAQQAVLPAETKVDPAALTDAERGRAGIVQLSNSQAHTVAALDCGPFSVIQPSTPSSRSGDSSRSTTPTSTASIWPTNSGWPGVYDSD
jgi:glutamine synthetase